MTTNTGGPAFPVRFEKYDSEGMTLRDYFAAKAMQGLLASGYEGPLNAFAKNAYALADAMLKARQA